MGNSSTKEKADHIDGGALLPHGVYSGPQDYDFRIVQRLILQRKLAPFYKGLEDWDDSEDAQEEKEKERQLLLLNANKAGKATAQPSSTSNLHKNTTHSHTNGYAHPTTHNHVRGHSTGASTGAHSADKGLTESERDMRRLYQGAIECPICFLYYPRNINRTRCCDKPMCTECFVQLKRLESAPTESPACPYCVEPHFGVIYSPALLAAGLLSSPLSPSASSSAGLAAAGGTSMSVSSSSNSIERTSVETAQPTPASPSTRRRSTSHKSPEVVTADELRPDWNRRILAAVQRQPGSRRASTSSSTMSSATFALGRRLAVGRQGGNNGSSSRRSNSSAAAADYNGYLTAMRNMGTDLEELMIMEAMRQSLQEEQDRFAREATAASASGAASGSASAAAGAILVASNSNSNVAQGSSPRSASGRGGAQHATVLSRSPLSSPPAPPSTDSSSSTSAAGHRRHLRTRGSLTGSSEEENGDGIEDEEDSDTDSELDSPARAQNRAIRFSTVAPIPAGGQTLGTVESHGGMPKHRGGQDSGHSNPQEAV